MLNKTKYYEIANRRKQKASTRLIKLVKFVFKLNLVLFAVCLLFFFIITRTSSNPENRHYPLGKLTLLAFLFTSFFSILALFTAEKSIITRFRKLVRYKRDYLFLQNILSSNKKFGFYLRDYKSGRTETSYYASLPGGNSGFQNVFGSSQMGPLTKKINKYLPIVLLDNENEKTDNYSGTPYYTNNNEWQQDFEFLAKKCFFLIVDYSTEFENSSNIESEINFIIENNLKIMICAKMEHLDALLARYPALRINMLFHIPVQVIQAGPLFGPKVDAFNDVSLPKDVKLFLKSLSAND